MDEKKNDLLLIIAIILLYTTWSSTYLAIRIAVRTIGPLMMTSVRFLAAGALMYIIAMLNKEKQPTGRELLGGSIVGIVLFLVSNVMLCYAEESVGSGLSAVAVSSGAFWICLISGFFGRWPTKMEWLGIAIGFAGIVILATGGEMKGNTAGTVVLLLSSIAWAFGSVLSKQVPVPKGFMGNAIEMLAGGLGSLIALYATGGSLADFHPSSESLWALNIPYHRRRDGGIYRIHVRLPERQACAGVELFLCEYHRRGNARGIYFERENRGKGNNGHSRGHSGGCVDRAGRE